MIPSWNFQTQYGVHRTRTFKQIFPSKEDFYSDYTTIGLGGFVNADTLNKLYILLYARKGNDAIFSTDETKFKYELFSIVYKYGPEYEKKAELQAKIRALTDAELEKGTTAIYNFANNPSIIPTTQEFEQLKKINSQNATGYKKSKLEYMELQRQALDSSYIDIFLKRFDSLFNPFPAEYPLLYNVEGED